MSLSVFFLHHLNPVFEGLGSDSTFTFQFQSADVLNPPSPSRGLDRQHVSAPDLSSLRVRSAAPPPPRLVAPPPPPPEDAVQYDEPRTRPVSVPVERLVDEVVALRRDNHQLRHMVQRTQTSGGGEREEDEQAARLETALSYTEKHMYRIVF